MSELSKRDKQIVQKIREGNDTEEIAAALGIGKWTVKGRVRRLCRLYDCAMRDLPATVSKAARR